MTNINQPNYWKDTLERLSEIREQEDYSASNVQFIREQLQSPDDRVRGGAALAAEGCLFEQGFLDILLDISENDPEPAIRRATIRTLGQMIHEGVMQNLDDETGSTTDIEYYEEWDEIQNLTLQEDYLRTKNLLFSLLQDEFEDREVRETSLMAVSDLGFLDEVRDWIAEFNQQDEPSSKIAAVYAMGKHPYYWEDQLACYLKPQTSKSLLLEAISSSYSSKSGILAAKIESLLTMNDPDILSYALLTLPNIGKTKELGNILQKFLLHPEESVRKSARQAISEFSKKSFSEFLKDNLGLEDDQ
jgi:HEAT repeat protein